MKNLTIPASSHQAATECRMRLTAFLKQNIDSSRTLILDAYPIAGGESSHQWQIGLDPDEEFNLAKELADFLEHITGKKSAWDKEDDE